MQQHLPSGDISPRRHRMSKSRSRTFKGALAAAVATAGLLTALVPGGAQAADNPYERGPAPSNSSIEASRGSYATSQTSVSSLLVRGFGGGTIYYPTSTSDGTFGAVVISPGFTAYESSIAWLGPRLASQGFVVFTIDTNTTLDQPASRGDQLLAALDYLTEDSSVRSRVDSSRLGVMGHSMGGGGTLEAAKDRPSLKAAIPLTGWNTDKTWPEVRTPTLIVGADGDTVASVASHSK
ncbi:dienelactone hydrolase family protein, partial [Streptomyces atroolivaceus]|uniref:dienelactone hydrolase family protein n=1 Tax=Streptomyces atroolivaceus TaxID=66869 RepID=UPI002024E544